MTLTANLRQLLCGVKYFLFKSFRRRMMEALKYLPSIIKFLRLYLVSGAAFCYKGGGLKVSSIANMHCKLRTKIYMIHGTWMPLFSLTVLMLALEWSLSNFQHAGPVHYNVVQPERSRTEKLRRVTVTSVMTEKNGAMPTSFRPFQYNLLRPTVDLITTNNIRGLIQPKLNKIWCKTWCDLWITAVKTKKGSLQWSSLSLTVPLTGDELPLIDTLTEGTPFLVKKLLNQLCAIFFRKIVFQHCPRKQ